MSFLKTVRQNLQIVVNIRSSLYISWGLELDFYKEQSSKYFRFLDCTLSVFRYCYCSQSHCKEI